MDDPLVREHYMSDTVCLLLALCTAALGTLALYVGVRSDNVSAKVGGSVITVIGILGIVACLMTG